MRCVVLLCFCFCHFVLVAQVVNIEKARKITDTTGLAGGLELQGSYLENEESILDLSVIPDLQYKTEKDLWLLIGSYNLTQTDDVDFQNSGLVHLRFNRKMNQLIRFEAFSQVQKDKVNHLDYRLLNGFGPRFKLTETNAFNLYVGILPMLELERSDPPELIFQREYRLSNYASFTYDINNNSSLVSTTYYQPEFAEFADFRFFTENKLSLSFLKNIDFDVTTTYRWDSRPPVKAPNRLFKISGGFSYHSQ